MVDDISMRDPRALYRPAHDIEWADHVIESDKALKILYRYKPNKVLRYSWIRYVNYITTYLEIIKAYSPVNDPLSWYDSECMLYNFKEVVDHLLSEDMHTYLVHAASKEDIAVLLRPLNSMVPNNLHSSVSWSTPYSSDFLSVCNVALEKRNLSPLDPYIPPKKDSSFYMSDVHLFDKEFQTAVKIFIELCLFHDLVIGAALEDLKIAKSEGNTIKLPDFYWFTEGSYNDFFSTLGRYLLRVYDSIFSPDFLNMEQRYTLISWLLRAHYSLWETPPFNPTYKDLYINNPDSREAIDKLAAECLSDLKALYDKCAEKSSIGITSLDFTKEFMNFLLYKPIFRNYIKQ